jgi:adenylate cyclase
MSDPMAVSRRLVAVFAADVEGYSRLMGIDEVGTLKDARSFIEAGLPE